jgi:membrane-associated phospholipid phosphatase
MEQKKHILPVSFYAMLFIMVLRLPLAASDAIVTAGDILSVALPLSAGGFTAYNRDWKATLQFAESAALNEGVTYSLKYLINEKRPNGGNYSFPSGHSSISFVTAEFMRKHYGWQYGLPYYALAAFVGYSRIEGHYHYFHDVAAGAGIGFLSAFVFTRPYKGISITTVSNARYLGLLVEGKF